MSDYQQARNYAYVTLVDRAGIGGTEIIHDGVRFVFKPGQSKLIVPLFLAEWLFRVEQHMVHTTDGEFVQRFGVEDAPEELTRRIGEQSCSPITIDTQRIEGWNVDAYAGDRDPEKTVVRQLRRNPADYANVGVPGQTFGNER